MELNLRKLGLASALGALVAIAAACGGSPEPREATVTPTTPPTAPSPSPTEEATTSPEGTASPSPTQAEAEDEVEIEVQEGEVQGPGRVRVAQGDDVRLRVTSDVADEVHVHGYDIFQEVLPGQPARIRFRADIPGIFEVELENAHVLILRLEVTP